MNEYREGFGPENLNSELDEDGGFQTFDGMPMDSVADGLVGAGDLSEGYPGGAGGPDDYSNVGAPAQNSWVDAIGNLFAEELKQGLDAFAKLFVDAFKVLGKLPMASLGGMWAGWIMLGIVLVPIGAIGSLVVQHYVNLAGKVTDSLAMPKMLFNGGFFGGGMLVAVGALTGFVMTIKLKRGDKTFMGEELVMTEADGEEDSDEDFGSVEECGYSEGDDVYTAEPENVNPYEDICRPPEIEPSPTFEPEPDNTPVVHNVPKQEINRALDNINSMGVLGNPKENLFRVACDILPCYTPDFTKVTELSPESPYWQKLENVILEALHLATGSEIDDIPTRIKSVKKAFMSFVVVATRYPKAKDLSKLDAEITGFLKKAFDDTGSAAVTVGEKAEPTCHTIAQGTEWLITIVMPTNKLVSLGDVYHTKEFKDYMKSGRKIPICLGINGAGQMINYDAGPDNSVMLCGQTRSGKSWFTMYYLLDEMIMQLPTEHQFILIDPKATGLYHSVALMPHVLGLHCPDVSDPNAPRQVIAILEEIMQVEGERRKKLFREQGYENYWDHLKGEGEKAEPLLTVVIDEFMDLSNALKQTKQTLGEDLRPRFMQLLSSIVSKLPAYGIRVLIIPHYVPGVVEPAMRNLMKFKATFRSNAELTESNLGMKSKIALPNAGDMVWTSEFQRDPLYTHGFCVAKDDNTMKDVFAMLAKAYYKLGVNTPDMSYLRHCFNRDDEQVVETLRNLK